MLDITIARSTIRSALEAICLWSQAAEDLVLGTGAHESHYEYLQQIGGPALGYWQMEPATHDSLHVNFLAYRPALSLAVTALLNGAPVSSSALVTNIPYAAAMCRVRYYDSDYPLPQAGDIEGYAAMWKSVYNSVEGAGTVQEFLDDWQTYIGTNS